MKKWMIRLFIAALLGTVSTVAFAGHIYNNKMKVYEDYQKRELDFKALGNIEVDSAVPINIRVTEGEPYVEFKQRFVDVLGRQPVFTLDVETRGDTSYITLAQEKDRDTPIFLIKENRVICNVYLPQQAINKLDIKNTHFSRIATQELDIKLNNIAVKALNIDAITVNALLDGEFENINIKGWNGDVEINSKRLAEVNINGRIVCKLKGDFSNINLTQSSTVWVESDLSSEVKIQQGGDITLRGNYHSIEAESNGCSNFDIKSDTLCKVELYNYDTIKLDGAFSEVIIGACGGDIDINTVIIPKRIDIRGDPKSFIFMLPSNTPGLDMICNWGYDGQGIDIISDFPIAMSDKGANARQYFFGDKRVKINIQARMISSLQVLDNGYISESINEKASKKTNENTYEEPAN